jgi:hypothetical protein
MSESQFTARLKLRALPPAFRFRKIAAKFRINVGPHAERV